MQTYPIAWNLRIFMNFCLESVLDIKYSTLMFKSTLFHYKLPIVEDYRHQILILAVKDLIDEIRTHCVLNTITVLCFSPNPKWYKFHTLVFILAVIFSVLN